MTKKKIVYISHPLSGNSSSNILKILAICQHVHKGQILPIAPYLTLLSYLDDSKAKDRAMRLAYNKEFFARSLVDELWLYGNTINEDMATEIRLAQRYGIAIKAKSPATKRLLTTYLK
jgi:hypothetical protein